MTELGVVYATCPSGHRFGTQKPTGKMMRCQRCLSEFGQTVLVMVPPRPAAPPVRLEVNWGTEECRTCGDTAPRPGEKLLPPGWMTAMIGLDPETDRFGRTRRFIGPCCGAGCLVAELRKTGHLLTSPPAGWRS